VVYRVERLSEHESLDTWRRLRSDVYLATGLLAEADLKGSSYTDEYEGHSRHVLVRTTDGQPAACARLIVRQGDDRPLQVERQFGITVPARSAEISGFAVREPWRDGLSALALVRAMVELAVEEGTDDLYAEVEPWFLASLNRAGFPLRAITEERFVFNAWNVVTHVSVSAFLRGIDAALVAGDLSPTTLYFSRPWNWSIGTDDIVPRQRGDALEHT
jgi:N-acyl-L-homoserine lactone synthetase